MKINTWFRDVIPSAFPMVLAWIGVGIMMVGCFVSVLYGMDRPGPGGFWGNAMGLMGIFVLTSSALAFEIGAWLENRAPSRAAMGCSAVLLLTLAAVATAASMYISSEPSEAEDATMGMLCLALPFILVFSIPLVYALVKLPVYLREKREERAAEIILAQGGEATYEELAAALGIPEEQVDGLLLRVVKSGRVFGFREVRHRRFYTVFEYKEKEQRLLGMVKARGEVPLSRLAEELNVPAGLLHEWIYSLVERGRFTGYIDWEEEKLYSVDAKNLREGGRCPNCSGEMSLAGKGVIRCGHCGSEIFL